MSDIKTLLDGELKVEIENLSLMENGSKEKASAVEDISKLYKLKIEEVKLECTRDEIANEQAKLKHEQTRLEQEQAKLDYERSKNEREIVEQHNDRIWKTGLELIITVAPLCFYAFWMKKGLQFEETGTFTSTTFKGLIGKFKPTRK